MATDLLDCDACGASPAPRDRMRVTDEGTFHDDGCPSDPLLAFWRGR